MDNLIHINIYASIYIVWNENSIICEREKKGGLQ